MTYFGLLDILIFDISLKAPQPVTGLFLVNATIVNAYILYRKTSRRQTKKKYAHLEFRLEITQGLIAGFSSRKRVAEPLIYIGPVTPENEFNHDNVHMGYKRPEM